MHPADISQRNIGRFYFLKRQHILQGIHSLEEEKYGISLLCPGTPAAAYLC